ncbi:hypothetical protein ACLOJK_030585 [Asimina triloba]
MAAFSHHHQQTTGVYRTTSTPAGAHVLGVALQLPPQVSTQKGDNRKSNGQDLFHRIVAIVRTPRLINSLLGFCSFSLSRLSAFQRKISAVSRGAFIMRKAGPHSMSRVYVGNLDPRVTERELEDEFRVYGVLRSIWVARKPPGYAFIDFDDRRDALDAIRELDGMLGARIYSSSLSAVWNVLFGKCDFQRECEGKNGWRVELSHNSKGGGGGRGGRGGRDRSSSGSDMKCYECGEPGHFARECRLRIGSGGLGSGRRRSRTPPRYRRSPSYGRRSYSPRDRSPRRRSSVSPPRARSYSRSPPYHRARDVSPYSNGIGSGKHTDPLLVNIVACVPQPHVMATFAGWLLSPNRISFSAALRFQYGTIARAGRNVQRFFDCVQSTKTHYGHGRRPFFYELKHCKVRLYPDEKKFTQSPKTNDSQHVKKPLNTFEIPSPLLRPNNTGRILSSSRLGRPITISEDSKPSNKWILDPRSKLVLKWNRAFLMSSLVALFIDPLHFYLPTVTGSRCLKMDLKLSIAVTCFRTIADLFYLLNIVLKFHLAYVAPNSLVFGKGELVTDSKKIAVRYLRSDFFVNLCAMLPLPQVLGASWYLLSIERLTACWKSQCRKETGFPNGVKCSYHFFDCDSSKRLNYENWLNNTQVFGHCDPDNDMGFRFGIFADALTSNIISSSFFEKYFFSLWWGLQNLSSHGQNLQTSTFIGETLFAICIAIFGLVLFAHLIGNMQTYLQSITMRLEEWRLKRKDTEEWMRHRQLPQNLRERVRRFLQYKWLTTRGVNERSILQALPADLRRDIQRHLCLDLVRRVPFFSHMDDLLLDAICEHLVSSLSTEGTYIVREGDPVTEMLFIIRGRLESSTTNGGRSGFFNSTTLHPGDFCGEELLAWALLPRTSNLPSSTRTVRAVVEVEAFALPAEDLKYVANQFRRLHSKQLQHTFRYYSHHWRMWAACFIQAAWRRFKRRQMAKELNLQETFYFPLDEDVGGRTVLQRNGYRLEDPTLLTSRFSMNMRGDTLQIMSMDIARLQKPEEPDFFADTDSY